MDIKTDGAEHSYPDIYFFINDQAAFGSSTLHDNREFVGIELEATGSFLGQPFAKQSLFRGAAGYKDLVEAHNQKHGWKPFSVGKPEERFLKFSGPKNKGVAQISVRAVENKQDLLKSFLGLGPKLTDEPISCSLSYISLKWTEIINDAVDCIATP